MKKIILYGIVAILCLSVLQMSMGANAEKKTTTIQPGLTYEVEYLNLNISDKLIWNWSVNQYTADFWLEDFDGKDTYYKVFDKTADIGSYVVPVPGLWKLVWENTEEFSASYDMSLLLTYNVSMEPRNLPPVASITVDKDKGPAPLTVSFTGAGDDTDGTVVSYAWDFGDGSKSNDQNPVHTYNNADTYTAVLNVTDNDGAHGEADIEITVEAVEPEAPTATIGTDKTSGDEPLTVAFTGTGTAAVGATIVSYHWDFGEGSTSDDQNPTFTFNAQVSDSYKVTLTVTDSNGKTGSAEVTITVTEPANQVVGLVCGPFQWNNGFAIFPGNFFLGPPTRGTLSATTNDQGEAEFDIPVPFGTYDWTLDKTVNGEKYPILNGTIVIDENTPSGETWWPADQLDSLVSPLTEEEWKELNGLDEEEPPVVEETFEKNVTEEVVVGDEKVEVTVSEVDNDTVTAKVGDEEVEIKKDEPIRVDSDGDGVDDVEITYIGEDDNGQPILKFEDVDVDKKSEAGTSPFLIVGIIIAILVLLIVIFIFMKKKKKE